MADIRDIHLPSGAALCWGRSPQEHANVLSEKEIGSCLGQHMPCPWMLDDGGDSQLRVGLQIPRCK